MAADVAVVGAVVANRAAGGWKGCSAAPPTGAGAAAGAGGACGTGGAGATQRTSTGPATGGPGRCGGWLAIPAPSSSAWAASTLATSAAPGRVGRLAGNCKASGPASSRRIAARPASPCPTAACPRPMPVMLPAGTAARQPPGGGNRTPRKKAPGRRGATMPPMKLATYKDGSRDGQLVVVSRDLSLAHYAAGIATRLQQVLDDWNFLSPQLEDLYATLNQGKARHAFPFEPRQCMAPLSRTYQRARGLAYLTHADRLCRARGQSLPGDALTHPLMVQAGSDDFLGPCQDAWFGAEAWGIDFGAELAAITGDVAMGANPEQGLDGIRLLALANDWRLRHLVPDSLPVGAGCLHGEPATAFAPVAVTPDELGEAWQGGRLQATLQVRCHGKRTAQLATGEDMHFHFGQLIAHLAKTRNVRAGSVIGSGPVSNADERRGVACLAERRALEALAGNAPATGYLSFGDTVQLEVIGRDGQSVFGAIAQRVIGPGMAEAEAEADSVAEADAADAAETHADSAEPPDDDPR